MSYVRQWSLVVISNPVTPGSPPHPAIPAPHDGKKRALTKAALPLSYSARS